MNGTKLGQKLAYPYSLFKQTDVKLTDENEKLGILGRKFSPEVAARVKKFKVPDIILRFNNSWADLVQIQCKFVSPDVAAHLITRSLGFESELKSDTVLFDEHWKYALLPKRNLISNSAYYMNYISPFDSLLVFTYVSNNFWRTLERKKVSELGKSLEKIMMKPIFYNSAIRNDYDDPYQGDRQLRQIAVTLHGLLSGQVFAMFKDNTEFPMSRFSSMRSLHGNFRGTNDFLMTSIDDDVTITEWRPLQAFINEHGSLYGPRTLKVMEAIGWPTRSSPNPLKLKKVVTMVDTKNNRKAS